MKSMGQIPEVQKTVRMTTTFAGYNHNEIINDGECYDMQNLSGDAYPAMTVRKARKIRTMTDTLEGIHGRVEALVTVRSGKVYYGEEDTGLRVSENANMMPKQFVSNGAYVIIWPDKVYFNTTDFSDRGKIERYWFAQEHVTLPFPGTLDPGAPDDAPTACICTGDGEEYDVSNITRSKNAPASPADGTLWIDINGKADVLRQWHDATNEWAEVPTVYVKITGNGIGVGIKEYDAVTISGVKYTYDTSKPSIDSRVEEQLKTLNGDYVVYSRGTDYIIIIGMLGKACILDETTMHVDRKAPDLDYICEANNRIWGCKYGKSEHREQFATLSADSVNMYFASFLYDGPNRFPPKSPVPDPNAVDKDLWFKTPEDNPRDIASYKLMQYDAAEDKWVELTPYVAIVMPYKGKILSVNQTIEISGLEYDVEHGSGSASVREEKSLEVALLNGEKTVVEYTVDDVVYPPSARLVIKGMLPFDNVNELVDNPICIDKVDAEPVFLNELHASALGDFRNWNKYMGLSTDSYTASIGTDGPWTGCIRQQGYPVFFKEDSIHKVYGYNPDSFQVQVTMCSGIQRGSWRSAAVVNETVYYKSQNDVMMYDGNMPRSVSAQLGSVRYNSARAGVWDEKLYLSMYSEEKSAYDFFCYDTRKGIWFREDGARALAFGKTGSELFYIDEENNHLVSVNGSGDGTAEDADDPIAWEAVFGISGIEYVASSYGFTRGDQQGHQYLSRFDLRLWLEESTKISMYIEYDSSGHWEQQGQIRGRNRRTFMLPVIPKRCDHLRVKLAGSGKFKLYSVARIMEVGSDG